MTTELKETALEIGFMALMFTGLILWLVLHPTGLPNRCAVCRKPLAEVRMAVTVQSRSGQRAVLCAECIESLNKAMDARKEDDGH